MTQTTNDTGAGPPGRRTPDAGVRAGPALPSHGTDTTAPEPAEVALDEVSAGYDGTTVLHGVTARLPRGAVTAIVGPNGAGKSTMVGVIAGVVRPDSGRVTTPTATRPALVVQQSGLPEQLPITVRDVVRMGRWARRGPWRRLRRDDHRLVEDALDHLGIAHLARRRLSTLSGGQRQRALVAQGLVQHSEVLLLDEPAAGLDVAAQDAIAAALHSAAADGTAAVHVTHDLADADRADHCVLLAGGRVLAEGPPADVLTHEVVDHAWGLDRYRGR
ncbi:MULTISPECIES: zinc ABC transporter ATP-binding protein AztA [Prauserella salsuginis group]|uniref:Zinc ABC transporter ATP-binding protein AztA n=1 Tax=Prauserella salsuginis TaxID=387889 RepID=A0ABW6GA37_9PSEU|nr:MULTISPECIES: zinc ABC transporter ATP-binding protein AztA [Prauserella salsuginis group]MCR3723060.1 zinc/manganese transport system ATP-binding protein [Prauserella flava]MCR3732565.1 zinc/manganese transport system ATP-binding protein [Prauserella salsuginis]